MSHKEYRKITRINQNETITDTKYKHRERNITKKKNWKKLQVERERKREVIRYTFTIKQGVLCKNLFPFYPLPIIIRLFLWYFALQSSNTNTCKSYNEQVQFFIHVYKDDQKWCSQWLICCMDEQVNNSCFLSFFIIVNSYK